LIRVNTQALKQRLAERAAELRDALLTAMVVRMQGDCNSVNARYNTFMTRIGEKPKDEQELVALKEYIRDGQATMLGLAQEATEIHSRLSTVTSFDFHLSTDDFLLLWSIREWPNKVAAATQASLHAVEEERDRMIQLLDREKLAFEKELELLEKQVEDFKAHSDVDNLNKIVDIGNTLELDLRNAKEKAEDFNSRCVC
jgi:hypothetical protein